MSKSVVSQNTLSGLLMFAVGLLVVFGTSLLKGKPKADPLIFIKNPGPVDRNIISILAGLGYSHRVANWWAGVSRFETGNYTSSLFTVQNNLFGMKRPQTRSTLADNPKTDTWARFPSLTASINDLDLYMKEFNYPNDFNSLSDFVSFMKSKGYFEETFESYFNGVNSRL